GDLTASENACSSFYRVEHLAMEVLTGTGCCQWSDLDAFLHGIAHWKRLGLFDKRFGEVVKQRFRHQEPLGANATLAVVKVARRHRELHGLRKIGVLQNDEWIGTAEFQHHSLAGSGRLLPHRGACAGARPPTAAAAARPLPVPVAARTRGSAMTAATAGTWIARLT